MSHPPESFHRVGPYPGIVIIEILGHYGNDGGVTQFTQGVEGGGDNPLVAGQAQNIEDGVESAHISYFAGEFDIADELVDIALPEEHLGVFLVFPQNVFDVRKKIRASA